MVDDASFMQGTNFGKRTDVVRKPSPTMLTLPQIAAQLQVSTKTVRRLLVKHGVPHVTVGAQIRIPVEHVHLLINKRW